MDFPSVGTDFHTNALVSASEVPLPPSPAVGANAKADVNVDVKLAVDASDQPDSLPLTDVGTSGLPELEHPAPPAEGDGLPFPSPLLPRVPAVTPAEFFEASAVPPKPDGQDPAVVQKADADTKKQQEVGVADYFSIPTRVVIIPGTPHIDGDGKDLAPNPGLLGAPVQRSDSVSVGARDRSTSLGNGLAPYLSSTVAPLQQQLSEATSVQPSQIPSKDVDMTAPTAPALDPPDSASYPSFTAAPLQQQLSEAVSGQPLQIPSKDVDMTALAAPALDPASSASNLAPTVLIVTAADRVPLGQQRAPKLQTLPEEGDLGNGSVEVPGSAEDQPKPSSWAEEVLQLIASQQAVLVGGPGRTITITSKKDALAAIVSGEQPELSELAAITTPQDLPKDLSQEDESPTPGKARSFLRKVRDAAQSLSRGHSRAAASKEEHPAAVPEIKEPEASNPAGLVYSNCPMKFEEVQAHLSLESDTTPQGNSNIFARNLDDAIPLQPTVPELPKDPSTASASTPPKKWRLYVGTFWNAGPSAVEDAQINLAASGNGDQPAMVDSGTKLEESGSAIASSEFSIDSSSDVDSAMPGKGRLFVRKARNAALRRSVLVVMLGHQLAGPTKDGLEALARGEIWVGPQDA